MRLFSSACLKLMGLLFGCWALFTSFITLPAFTSLEGFSLSEAAFVIPLFLNVGLQLAIAFWLIFRTESVLNWARFPDAEIPQLEERTILRTGILLFGLSIFVNALGYFIGDGLGMIIRDPAEPAPNPRGLLPYLFTGLTAFGLIRFSHKLAALFTRWQTPLADTE